MTAFAAVRYTFKWAGGTTGRALVPLPHQRAPPDCHPATGCLTWGATAQGERTTLCEGSQAALLCRPQAVVSCGDLDGLRL